MPAEGDLTSLLREQVSQVISEHLSRFPVLLERIIAGTIELF
jgi:hypothetical protein